jgi:hypothetical protein
VAKLSKSAIKQKADEWADKKAAIDKAESARAAAIDPIITRHDEELKPVLTKHDKKIEQLQAQADEIENEIFAWLELQEVDTTISGEKAVASSITETTIGQRIIDVQKFIKAAKSKGEAMWDCISVAVAKAEKLIGKKEIDAISTKKETTGVVNSLRLK